MNEIAKSERSSVTELARFRRRILELRELIAAETDIERMTDLVGAADSIEEAMCNAGYRRDTEAIRPANEARFEARWKLGQLSAKVERRVGRPSENCPGSGQFRAYLTDIGLNKNRANECQRISAIPEAKLRRAFEETAQEGVLNTIDSMFLFARPFWKIKERVRRHRAIRDAAEAVAALEPESFGPFALIYADPPTHFETFTEGSYRGPNQHYPTLSWEEIENFTLYGKRVEQIAHEHAMLFLWCTSSNLHYGLRRDERLGIDFKASAAWDKGVQGTDSSSATCTKFCSTAVAANRPARSMCRHRYFAIRAADTAPSLRRSARRSRACIRISPALRRALSSSHAARFSVGRPMGRSGSTARARSALVAPGRRYLAEDNGGCGPRSNQAARSSRVGVESNLAGSSCLRRQASCRQADRQ